MLMKARFCAYVDGAEIPRHRSPKSVMQVFDTVVDIPVADHGDLPVAVSTYTLADRNRKEDFQEFRFDGNGFFRATHMDATAFEETVLSNPFHEFGALRKLQVEQARLARPGASLTLPRGLVEMILHHQPGIWLRHYEFYRERRDGIVLPLRSDHAVETARQSFRAACASFVILDGAVWARCPEPLLAVDIVQRPGRIRVVTPDLPEAGTSSWRGWRVRPHLDEVLFSVPNADEAYSLADGIYDRTAPWRGRDLVAEVAIPSAFSDDVPLGDVAAQLALGVDLLASAKKDMPVLRNFLDDGKNWTEDRLHHMAQRIYDMIPDHDRRRAKALEFQLSRYENSDIHVPITMPVPRG